MRAVLAATMVCFVSSLVYCAEPIEDKTPRAEEIKANFDKLVSEDQALKKEALDYFRSVDKTFATEVPLFTYLLKDKRYQIRAISAFSLGKIGQAAAGAIPEVEQLLTDSSATVQKYAKRALERLKPFKPVSEKVAPEEASLPQKPRASTPTPDEVVDVIKGLGGKLKFDKNKAVVSVDLFLKKKVTDADLVHLKGLTGLKQLDLLGTTVTDVGLTHLKGLGNLQSLNLNATKEITDAGLVHLKGLTKLKDLWLWNAKVTDAGLVHLKGMTQLKTLGLSYTKVTDAGLVHLKGLTNLESLLLNNTKVTDAGLVHLKGLTKLEKLNLNNTTVTGPGLVHLEGLTKLNLLNLDSTHVTDAGLKHLKGLTKLEKLLLSETRVTDAGKKKLQQALPNCKIKH